MAATQDSSPEGFAFEPEYTEEELPKFENEYDTEAEFAEIEVGLDHGTGSTSGADISRLNNLHWCNCSNCAMMPTLKESLCCKEMKLLKPYLDNLSLTCFVNHTDFSAVCLNRSVLRASFAGLKEFKNRGQTVNIPNDFENRTCRLLAYRNFTSWVHGRLGHGIRRVIPSCIVERIRKQFPEENGVYTGFIQGDDDSAEYDASWVLELDA